MEISQIELTVLSLVCVSLAGVFLLLFSANQKNRINEAAHKLN